MDKVAKLTKPSAIHWVDGSKEEYDFLCGKLMEAGTFIKLNEERFGLAQDAREKVAVLRETAHLWETKGNDELRAFDATRAAFELDPEDGETRAGGGAAVVPQ